MYLDEILGKVNTYNDLVPGVTTHLNIYLWVYGCISGCMGRGRGWWFLDIFGPVNKSLSYKMELKVSFRATFTLPYNSNKV